MAFILTPILNADDASLSSTFTDAIAQGANALAIMRPYLNFTALFVIFGTVLAIEIVLGLYKLIMWGMKKIPGIN